MFLMDAAQKTLPKKMKQSTAAKYFGVSRYFLRKIISEGRISYTKIGNNLMIDTEELEKYINDNTYRKSM